MHDIDKLNIACIYMYALTFIHLLHIQLKQGADLLVLLVLLRQGEYPRSNLQPLQLH